MRKKYIFGKKLYISILTSILVLLTTVATTFAWVGVFANSTFENFDVIIKSSSLEEYGIEISLTGEEGTFSDSISSEELKRVILKNWGYNDSFIDDIGVDLLFSTLNMEQCTTIPNILENKMVSLNDFTDIEGNVTNDYFYFDIYLSATHSFDSGNPSDYKLDVYLDNEMFSGSYKTRTLFNSFLYPQTFNNPLINAELPDNLSPVLASTKIDRAKVNSKSSARVSFEKYEVIDKYHPEIYNTKPDPVSTIIYTGDDYNYPVYDELNNSYDFGGILEDDINIAIGNYNLSEWMYSKEGIKKVSVLDSSADIYGGKVYAIRGVNGSHPDTILSENTNHLIDSMNHDEQIGINQMMKIKVSFWFEGWDADCWNATGGSPVTISISMSIKPLDE